MNIVQVPTQIGFASNCYLLISDGEAAVIDPSAPVEAIERVLTQEKARLTSIFLTHGHFDHLLNLKAVQEGFGVDAWIHRSEMDFPANPMKNASAFFFEDGECYGTVNHSFSDGDELMVGKAKIHVAHFPGHTQGSCAFIVDDQMITGDVLFAAGYGRTDLFSGNNLQMDESLHKLASMSKNYRIYPGHGQKSTLLEAIHWLGCN